MMERPVPLKIFTDSKNPVDVKSMWSITTENLLLIDKDAICQAYGNQETFSNGYL